MTQPRNRIIELLPRRSREQLLSRCELVDLALSQVLCEPGEVCEHAYFPTEAFISLVTSMDGKPVLEVGMTGFEGMLGSQLSLGVTVSPLHAVVQGAGLTWRMSAKAFCRELAQNPQLQKRVHQYIYVLMGQMATSAGCTRFHEIAPRLARWLLMTQDRARSSHFHVTHTFLSYMLGVRREGITEAAGELQRKKLITYHRGALAVLNRQGLEAVACGCYRIESRAYANILH
jgi:CRP-like cAMP-binding protein